MTIEDMPKLLFVLGLPVFWLLEALGGGGDAGGATPRPTDINRPS